MLLHECCRFWLVDCGSEKDPETIVSAAAIVYDEVVAVPIMARFIVYARRHLKTEAQLRVLCLTSDLETSTTLESQQNFHEVGRLDSVEVNNKYDSWSYECKGNFMSLD